MSTQIGDLIFETNSTLLQVLDTLDVPTIAERLDATNERLDEVNDQLRQLGIIVDTNQIANNTSFIAVNTRVDTLQTEFTVLNNQFLAIRSEVDSLSVTTTNLEANVANLSDQVTSFGGTITGLQNRVTALESAIYGLNSSIVSLQNQVTSLQGTVSSLQSSVNTLVANRFRDNLLFRGNEYMFTWRAGTTTYFRRTTFSGGNTQGISANIGYSAQVLDSQTGTTTTQTVFLCAPFDTIRTNGTYNYPITQGPVTYSYSSTGLNSLSGYITAL
nr:MAG: hypothetical protein [Chemarfal virus 126]